MHLSVDAPAKLNLFLHVTGKRPDGFHLLQSLIVFTAHGDRLEIELSDTLQLAIDGPFARDIEAGPDDNLVMRAARAIGGGHGARIRLHKHIPVGAGLGGGSADAAAVLRGLQALWQMPVPMDRLQRIALQLGSDVPVCLAPQPAWVDSMGERVTPALLEVPVGVLLVNPGKPLLTAEVFRRFAGPFDAPLPLDQSFTSPDALIDYLLLQRNALETAAIQCIPEIEDVLAAIAATGGCRLARMSGSGATCFGLYENRALAQAATETLKDRHPEWWCVDTELYGQAQ